MPPKTLSVGIAGLGRIATRFHLPALLRIRGVTIAAVADPREEARARARRALPGSAVFGSWEALLDGRPALDAVVNCLPTELHAASAVAVLQAGKALYLEKPLGTTLEEARGVAEAWAAATASCQVGFNFRFHPAIARARALLARGVLGEPISAECLVGNPPRPQAAAAGPLSAFRDLAVHHIDLLRFLLADEFVEVTSVRASRDGAAVLCDAATRQGLLARITTAATAARLDRLTVVCRGGTLTVDRFGAGLTVATAESRWRRGRLRGGAELACAALGQLGRAAGTTPDVSYRRALEAFAVAVREGLPPTPDVADGLCAAEVVHAAQTVLERGIPVAVIPSPP